jgi:hypothetical protein
MTPMLATHTHPYLNVNSHTAFLVGGGGFAALATFGVAIDALGGKTPATWVDVIVAIVGMVSGYLFARQVQ